MGEIVIRRAGEAPGGLSIRGLGSCIALFVYDAAGRAAGGLAHVMLPEPAPGSPLTSPGKFAPTAVAALIDQLLQQGVRRDDLVAKLAGGAHMFPFGSADRLTLGERNIRATLEALQRERIEVTGMDVGGSSGRTVVAHVDSGRFLITSLKRSPKEL